MEEDRHSKVLEQVNREMDIVPYTRRDRIVTYIILVIVVANFVTLIISGVGAFL